jgi:EAL domain-containing protein (putative c-di-GMP-specific phosphodiesterase class I)
MKIDIINSILAINPNAVVNVSGDDVNKIEWLENTPIIANNIILAKQIELQEIEDNKIQNQEANKQSALNKLKALGLNDAEIKSIIG